MKAIMEPSNSTMDDWEQLWAPHDEPTYRAVLAAIRPEDRVLEIGAGDLRLAVRAAAIARQVYAIEFQTALLAQVPEESLPGNLVVVPRDARYVPFPPDITTAVLLMRHCNHFSLYVKKLQAVGCRKLITNARWRTGLEHIDLNASRLPYENLELGWFACLCGSAGFKTGPVEQLTEDVSRTTVEVMDCPGCLIPIKDWKVGQEVNPKLGDLSSNLESFEGPTTLFLEGARAK